MPKLLKSVGKLARSFCHTAQPVSNSGGGVIFQVVNRLQCEFSLVIHLTQSMHYRIKIDRHR